jgi:hypothetical protein
VTGRLLAALLCGLSLVALVVVEPAAAKHHTCTVSAYAPVKNRYPFPPYSFRIDFWPGARANCAAGTKGRLFFTAQRHRWWGWQELYRDSKVLNASGDATEGVWLDCPGPTISEGTWTFRSRGVLGVAHWYGWRYITVLGPERRYGCYD